MSGDQIVQLIAIFASLVLVSAGLAGRRLSWSKSLQLGFVWAGIFIIVALFVSIVSGAS